MRRFSKVVVVALFALALLALTGCACDMVAKKATEEATGVKVDEQNDSVTITGKDGSTASMSDKEGELPEGLSDDVPIYEGTVKSSATMDTAEGTSYQFSIETKDDATKVINWYKNELTEKGWTVSSTITTPEGGMVGAENGEKNKIAITVGEDASTKMTTIAVVNNVEK